MALHSHKKLIGNFQSQSVSPFQIEVCLYGLENLPVAHPGGHGDFCSPVPLRLLCMQGNRQNREAGKNKNSI